MNTIAQMHGRENDDVQPSMVLAERHGTGVETDGDGTDVYPPAIISACFIDSLSSSNGQALSVAQSTANEDTEPQNTRAILLARDTKPDE